MTGRLYAPAMTELPPTTDPDEIEARLRMPMADAMRTQRAVRRLVTTRAGRA